MAKRIMQNAISQVQRQAEEVAKLLDLRERENNPARLSLTKLCEAGCDPHTLGEMLAQWKEWTTHPILEIKGREVQLRPMDDWEAALGRFKPRYIAELDSKIRKLRDGLQELQRDLIDLRETRLVTWLHLSQDWKESLGLDQQEPVFVDWEVFNDMLAALEAYRTSVLPVIVKAAHKIGPKRKPGQGRLNNNLLRYVLDSTGHHYYYEDIARILQALHRHTSLTAEALKQGQYRAKGNRKASFHMIRSSF
jgi:hypothetical protein